MTLETRRLDPRHRAGPAAAVTPPRPGSLQGILAGRLFRAASPRIARQRSMRPPRHLAPYARFEIDRRRRGRRGLAATWYEAAGAARGAVLLAPPWTRWGQAYFHRHGRLEALRAAGYHALSFDFGGVGSSGPPPEAFYDDDVADALAELAERAAGLPIHLWGVSFGGYWAHPVLTRTPGVAGAMFEDVPFHLIEWSKRLAPLGYPFYLVFQHLLRSSYRYLDLRRHAPHLQVGAAAYVGGESDRGVRAEETRELARRAGGGCRTIAGAGHLEAIKTAGSEVIALALATFERGASRITCIPACSRAAPAAAEPVKRRGGAPGRGAALRRRRARDAEPSGRRDTGRGSG